MDYCKRLLSQLRPGARVMLLLLAVFCSSSWSVIVSRSDSRVLAGSLPFIVFTFFCFLLFAWSSTRKSAYSKASVVIGVLLSFAIVIGSNIEASGVVDSVFSIGSTDLLQPKTLVLFFGIMPVSVSCLKAVFEIIERIQKRSWGMERQRRPLFGMISSPRAIVIMSAAIILLLWIPVLLALYPGIDGYDSTTQIRQVLNGQIDSKHPVLHTLLIGVCYRVGLLLGSCEAGLLLYSVAQMTFMALAFGALLYCVYDYSKSNTLYYCCLCWFALSPINSVFAVSVTKDVLFCGFAVLSFCVWYLRKNRPSIANGVLLVVAITVTLLLRNNAVVAYVIFLAVFFVCGSEKSPGLIRHRGCFLAPLFCFALVVALIYPLCGVVNTSASAESLSVPLQQLARTALTSDDLSDSDKALIDELIPEWRSYQAGISDVVKNSLNQEYLKDNTLYVAMRYLAIGISHLQEYTDSFLLNTYGYWYPNSSAIERGGFTYHPFFELPSTEEVLDGEWVSEESRPSLVAFGEQYEDAVGSYFWESISLYSTMMCSGAVIWVYVVAIGYCAVNRRFEQVFFISVAMIAYWGTCLLGPCALVRYIYPLFAFVPMVIAGAIRPQNLKSYVHSSYDISVRKP